jgi:hypothetical protein
MGIIVGGGYGKIMDGKIIKKGGGNGMKVQVVLSDS